MSNFYPLVEIITHRGKPDTGDSVEKRLTKVRTQRKKKVIISPFSAA